MKKLTFRNVVIDTAMLIALGGLQFCVGFIVLFVSSPIFACGNDYLREWLQVRDVFILTLIIAAFQVLFTLGVHRMRTVIFKYALWFITFTFLFPLFLIGQETFSYSKYYQEFDAKIWQKAEVKPLSMIRVFHEDQRFIGKKKEELITILGEKAICENQEDRLSYYTEASPLFFKFENDTVVTYYLQCYD